MTAPRLSPLPLLVLLVACSAPPGPAGAETAARESSAPELAPRPTVVLSDDGGWCWFQDERALALGDFVVVGSVASGHADSERAGDIELVYWWPGQDRVEAVELEDRLQRDDHAAPALCALDDGRLLAAWSRHGNDRLLRTRRTLAADRPLEWGPLVSTDLATDRQGLTYSNLHAVGEQLYDFGRLLDWDPTLLVSRDQGASWMNEGRVLGGPGRPYVKYASRGDGRVHLVATEQHPRDFDNGLYHGFVDGRGVHASDGRVLGRVGTEPPAPNELTRVFEGRPEAVAWPADLELDAGGEPVVVFTVQVDGAGRPRGEGGFDHRFWYARHSDGGWMTRELGFAGTRLYAGEDDYTGLAAIDPGDPNVVYLSTDAHPRSGEPLVSAADGRRHRELFRAVTRDAGRSWEFTALTRDSTADQLRPIVPAGEPHVLLWLRGRMESYTRYEFEIVGRRLD